MIDRRQLCWLPPPLLGSSLFVQRLVAATRPRSSNGQRDSDRLWSTQQYPFPRNGPSYRRRTYADGQKRHLALAHHVPRSLLIMTHDPSQGRIIQGIEADHVRWSRAELFDHILAVGRKQSVAVASGVRAQVVMDRLQEEGAPRNE